jgi:hypothetical protein
MSICSSFCFFLLNPILATRYSSEMLQNHLSTHKNIVLNLAPPSSYNLNLKTLTKVSKVSWTSQRSHEILWSWFERKVRKDKLHFFQKTPPKSPGLLALRYWLVWYQLMCCLFFSREKQWLKLNSQNLSNSCG